MKCLLGMVQAYTTSSSSREKAATAQDQPAAAKGDGSQGSPAASSSPVHVLHQPAGLRPSAGVVLMRQLEQFQLFPTAEQLHLVDKKFGGGWGCSCDILVPWWSWWMHASIVL
jgi:hypothetical protein